MKTICWMALVATVSLGAAAQQLTMSDVSKGREALARTRGLTDAERGEISALYDKAAQSLQQEIHGKAQQVGHERTRSVIQVELSAARESGDPEAQSDPLQRCRFLAVHHCGVNWKTLEATSTPPSRRGPTSGPGKFQRRGPLSEVSSLLIHHLPHHHRARTGPARGRVEQVLVCIALDERCADSTVEPAFRSMSGAVPSTAGMKEALSRRREHDR
jgi:hypothetical protein